MLGTRMLMRPPRRITLATVMAIAALLVAPLVWYLASPLILTRSVSETAPTAAAQTRVASGQFRVVDGIHKGEGTAAIVRLADGQWVLRLDDDFRVTNGPDLYVYLSGATAPRTRHNEGGGRR